jgi:hypothetical protein
METSRPVLRFGIMCNGATFPLWQARCLEALLKMEGVQPALLIVDGRPSPPASSLWKRLKTLLTFRVSLFSLYNRYFVQRRAKATVPVDMKAALEEVPRIRCEVVKKGKFSEYFTPQDVETIRGYSLDFVLRFAFNIIRGEILTIPQYGVWSFHHGDEQKYRGAPPCFWEIYRDEPTTGSILQRLTERLDGGVILKKDSFPTALHSYPRNRDAAHLLGTDWPAAVCRDILGGRAEYLAASPTSSSAPIYLKPANREMLVFGYRQFRHQVSRVFQGLRTGTRRHMGTMGNS